MANTSNYNLKKVEYTEMADIPAHFNGNMDMIDTTMKTNADSATAAEVNAKSYASGLIGTLSNLLTTAKNNIVAAVNEIFGKVEDVEADLLAHKADTVTQEGGAHGLDIESGEWTPRFVPGNHTHSKQEGKYVRIGKLVFVSGNLQLSAKDEEATGNLAISGLPFVSNFGSAVTIGGFNHLSFGTAPVGVLYGATAGNSIALRYAADNDWGGNMQVDKLTYRTSMQFSAVYSIN